MSTCKSVGDKRRSTKRRSTRRRTHKRRGGAANGMGAPANMAGGKRRRTAKKANKWSEFVKQVYHKGKRADKDYTFSMALQEASRLKKAGKMHA